MSLGPVGAGCAEDGLVNLFVSDGFTVFETCGVEDSSDEYPGFQGDYPDPVPSGAANSSVDVLSVVVR